MKKFYYLFAVLLGMLFNLPAAAQEGVSSSTENTILEIGFMNGAFAEYQDQVEIKIDGQVSKEEKVSVPLGTVVEIKATEGYSINNVYYCNKEVEAVDGVYTATVDVANPMIAIDMKEAVAKGTASVKVTGRFYNITAQKYEAEDAHDAELFQYTAEAGIDKTEQIFIVGEMKVRLIAQAEDNAVYVTVNGQPVASENASMFEKVLTLKPGDEVVVLNAEQATGVATAYVKGLFYTISAQLEGVADTHAADVFSFTPGGEKEIDEYVNIPVNEEKTIRLIGQAPDNAFYVTLDGKKVVSSSEDHFEAVVTLKNGSILNVANASEYAATININGKFYTFSVQDSNASGKAAELYNVVPGGEEINETATIELNAEEVEVRLIGQNEGNAFYVTLDGKNVASTSEENFEATVTLKNGSVLNVANTAEYAATININGKFYTFSVQNNNVEGKAGELYSVTPAGEEINETATIELGAEEVEVRLIGQAENNAFYVTLDGKTVASTSKDNFDAVVTLKNGSVLNVANASEYAATININGKFYTFTVQNPNASGKDAELYSVVPGGEEIEETKSINLDAEEVEVRLVGQAEDNKFYVTINGLKVVSTSKENFEAIVTLKAGDVINVLNAEPATGVATVNIKGNFWNVSAQDVNIEDPRAAEVFSFTVGEDGNTEVNEKVKVAVNETKTIKLTVQNETNEVYVALNDVEVASAMDGMFQAVITLKAGDVLVIAENKDLATGINTITVASNGKVYNMQGVEVKANKTGLYIINGKKVMVK